MIKINEYANNYKNKGWTVIPVDYQKKMVSLKNWSQRKPEDYKPEEFAHPQNIGIVLGDNSGGLIDIDLDCPEALELAPSFLPDTGMIFGRDSNRKSHWIYRVTGNSESKRFQSNEGTLLEIRGNRAQTVFPPSIHPSGERIEFDIHEQPATVSRNEIDKAVTRLAAASLLVQNWKEGNRHDLALMVSGWLLRSEKWSFEEVIFFIQKICEAANDLEIHDRLQAVTDTMTKLNNGHLVTGLPTLAGMIGDINARKLQEWLGLSIGQVVNSTLQDFHNASIEVEKQFTDIGNAKLFVGQHKGKVQYIEDIGCWMVWNEKRWDMDAQQDVRLLAHETADSLYSGVVHSSAGMNRDDTFKWAKKSSNRERINAMLSEAAPYLLVQNNALDNQPWLLNCSNGIIDLQTSQLKMHTPESFITQYTDVAYNPDAECPAFLKFLDDIFKNDPNMLSFVQRALGYSLTGDTGEQCFFVVHGSGANGKSTLLETVEAVLGDYVSTTPVSTLMADKNKSSIPNDIARLRGKRLVKASEGETHQQLSESLIKRLTGGDTVTARFMQKEFFEFKPVCKIWLATNHKPKISCDDPALWRRVHLLPFEVTIPEKDRDPQLKLKLLKEKEGILNWMVQGCLEWQKQGLNPPSKVRSASEAYQQEMDGVGIYLAECTELAPGSQTTKKALYNDYSNWCELNGYEKLTKNKFGQKLIARGMEEGRTGEMGHFWKKIAILNPNENKLFDN